MSNSIDSLTAATASLSAQVPLVLAALADAKSKALTSTQAEAIDKAAADITTAAASLAAAVTP